MKRQFLVTQLAGIALSYRKQRNTDSASSSPSRPVGLMARAAQLGRPTKAITSAMRVQPRAHGLKLATNLVLGEQIEYTGLDDAVLAHCRLRRLTATTTYYHVGKIPSA